MVEYSTNLGGGFEGGMRHGSRVRALVIDDDAAVCRALDRRLRAAGCEVSVATGGEAGVKVLLDSSWDLVLCDLCMPGVDGVAVARVAAHLARPPLFRIMTGTPNSDLVPLVSRVVCAEPVAKPLGAETVRDLVARALELRGWCADA